MVKFQQKQVKGGEIMEQILNKLSEIETTARRIMEDADRTKAALSSEWNSNAEISMQPWSRKQI